MTAAAVAASTSTREASARRRSFSRHASGLLRRSRGWILVARWTTASTSRTAMATAAGSKRSNSFLDGLRKPVSSGAGQRCEGSSEDPGPAGDQESHGGGGVSAIR